MKVLPARKTVGAFLAVVLVVSSHGAHSWAASVAGAKSAAARGGLPMRSPAILPAFLFAGFQPAPGGTSAGVGLPLPAIPLTAFAERLGELATVIGPDVESLQARGRAERVLAPEVYAVPLPDPALKRINPKIAVTPVSEPLSGVFFVKFHRGTTLETMLAVLARNGVKPELYADNGDGWRARIALPEGDAARAASLLASEGQVEGVEVSRRVYDLLRRAPTRSERFRI